VGGLSHSKKACSRYFEQGPLRQEAWLDKHLAIPLLCK
jgi:hypothetical protein